MTEGLARPGLRPVYMRDGILVNLSGLYLLLGDYVEAERSLQAVLENERAVPFYTAVALETLGCTRLSQGRPLEAIELIKEGAEKYLDFFCEVDDNSMRYLADLVEALVRADLLEEADRAATRVAAASEDRPSSSTWVLTCLSRSPVSRSPAANWQRRTGSFQRLRLWIWTRSTMRSRGPSLSLPQSQAPSSAKPRRGGWRAPGGGLPAA